jgi:hypothetical protein
VVAAAARVQLHDQAVVQAHRGHLGQHLAAEQPGLLRTEVAAHDLPEQRPRLRGGEIGGERRLVAMVGGGGPHADEEIAALAVRAQVAVPVQHVLAGELAEAPQRAGEGLVLRIDHFVRAVGGEHAAAPAAVADRLVVRQRVQRAFGGGDHLDIEALEQRAGAERVGLQRSGDGVVVVV